MNASTSTSLVPLQDMQRMAEAIAKSQLFGMKTADQALALMIVAQAEGRHPGSVASDYHIIQGRPALKADAILGRFQDSGGIVKWTAYTDTKVSGQFMHPKSPTPVTVEWTIDMAKRANLANKENWKTYPRAMLRARVISEGVRTCFPSVCSGVYTPEEVQDFGPAERDITSEVPLPSAPITPTTGALDALSADRQEVVMATAAGIRTCLSESRPMDAYALCETSGFDNDEKVALWSLLDSKVRAAIKRMAAAEKAAERGAISEPQKKRLEALVKEYQLDREKVKDYCQKAYGKQHFSELTPSEYTDLEATLQALKEDQEAA